MQLTARRPKIMVSANGTGIVSQAGGLLLTQTLRATGLDRGLTAALERWRPPRAVHDPGSEIHARLPVSVQATCTFMPVVLCLPEYNSGCEAHDQHGSRVPSTMY